jgi:hypothetical protein
MNIQIQNFRSIQSLNQTLKMNDVNIVQNSDVLEAMAIGLSRSLNYLSSAYQRFAQQGRGFEANDNNASVTIQLNDVTWTCSSEANKNGDEKQLAQYCQSFIQSENPSSPLFIYYDKDFFESEIKIDTKLDDGDNINYPTTAMKNALANNTKSQIATWFWHRENTELRSKQPDRILTCIRQFCKNIYINSNNEFVVTNNNEKTLLSELPIQEQNTIFITMDLIRRAMIARTNNKNMIVLIDNFKNHIEPIAKILAKDMTFITC